MWSCGERPISSALRGSSLLTFFLGVSLPNPNEGAIRSIVQFLHGALSTFLDYFFSKSTTRKNSVLLGSQKFFMNFCSLAPGEREKALCNQSHKTELGGENLGFGSFCVPLSLSSRPLETPQTCAKIVFSQKTRTVPCFC